MSRPKRKSSEHAFGLTHGFAKLLKDGVNKSIKKNGLQQERAPGWWPKLPAR